MTTAPSPDRRWGRFRQRRTELKPRLERGLGDLLDKPRDDDELHCDTGKEHQDAARPGIQIEPQDKPFEDFCFNGPSEYFGEKSDKPQQRHRPSHPPEGKGDEYVLEYRIH